jgi:HlyD family secretion protein
MSMKKRNKIVISMLALLVVVGGLVLAFRPKPVPVQVATATLGPLRQTVEEEGKTRMHDHFVLAASVAGKLRRIELHAGDSVRAGQLITWIDPTPIEPRQTAVLEARLASAQATQRQAEADVGATQAENNQAATDLERTRKLFGQGVTSREAYDKAVNRSAAAGKQLDSAKSRVESAIFQVREAEAALTTQAGVQASSPVAIRSPIAGRVLKLVEQSERVVTQGTPIIDIGHTPRLEVVADFLTQDAVKINPSMDAIIDDWGGDKPLRARVRLVEPGAFTKVSALGVEEQRVNVVLDFVDSPEKLADAYRVEAQVVIWQSNNLLKVPSSALSRVGQEWIVFRVQNGRARRTVLQLGHRGASETEVLEGMKAGDIVIIHPSTEIDDGVRVAVKS